jgi:undecaprenyl-diphosphatase
MTNRSRLFIFFGLFAFLECLFIFFVDQPLSQFIHLVDQDHKSFIDFFRAYTDLGKSKWYICTTLLIIGSGFVGLKIKTLSAASKKTIEFLMLRAAFLFSAIVVSGLITDIFKPIIGRARPVMIEREGFYGFRPMSFDAVMNSMPSGHTTTAFALATALTLLFPRARLIWFCIGIVLAVSRVMVNAHFISDIIAGCFIGMVTTVLIHKAFCQSKKYPILKSIFPINKDISVI